MGCWSDVAGCRALGSGGHGLETLLTGVFSLLFVQFSCDFNASRSPLSGAGVLLTCFKPKNYSTAEPLSCFFVASDLSQDIEIGAMNIDLLRRKLQGFPKKIMVISFVCMLNNISMAHACCKSCACVYRKYVQCFGPKSSFQFLWIDIHCPVFCFYAFTIKKNSLESWLLLL